MLLKGIVGSTAYGLDREGSDVDHLGVFAAPTSTLLGLRPPMESKVSKDPDVTLHEALKFVKLCLNGNPTTSELLWLDKYEEITDEGAALLDVRRAFLSAPRVRDAYLGYATSQFKRLAERGDGSFSADTRKRTEKHARHLVRLVEQGFHLYVTGELVVDLRSDASRVTPEWVFSTGRRLAGNPEAADEYLERAGTRFDGVSSPLPDRPDERVIEEWLLNVRRANIDVGWLG